MGGRGILFAFILFIYSIFSSGGGGGRRTGIPRSGEVTVWGNTGCDFLFHNILLLGINLIKMD